MRRSNRLSLEQLAPCLLTIPDPPAPLDWAALFGNARPVELEVGFGKGLFLLTAAQARPDVNFAGLEIVRKYQLFAATRLVKRGLANVRVACGDAKLFLRDCVAPGSLAAVHVYFPDPWWKRRHWKRRVFTAEFAEQCARVLHDGGRLHAVTDVEAYAHVMSEVVAGLPIFRPVPPPPPSEAQHDLDYLTNFERKFRKEGRPIYRMGWEKTGTIRDHYEPEA